MIYTGNNLTPLWEENIAKHCEQNSMFVNVSCISSLPDAKHSIEEYLLENPFNSYIQNDPYLIPSEKDREGYCVNNDFYYWHLGLSDFLKIQYIAKKYNVNIDRYFDFGCASGRVLRHFLCQSNTSEIWGSDINSKHINWINQFLPKIKAIFNHTIPSLPLEDNYFDVVSAFSVFTHIDTFEIAWLSELRRILKPNGIAYITYHDEANWEILKSEKNNNNRVYRTLKKCNPNIEELLEKDLPSGRTVFRHSDGPYRSLTYHSIDYIKNVWGRFFTIVEIIPKFHARQSVIILKKHEQPTT